MAPPTHCLPGVNGLYELPPILGLAVVEVCPTGRGKAVSSACRDLASGVCSVHEAIERRRVYQLYNGPAPQSLETTTCCSGCGEC